MSTASRRGTSDRGDRGAAGRGATARDATARSAAVRSAAVRSPAVRAATTRRRRHVTLAVVGGLLAGIAVGWSGVLPEPTPGGRLTDPDVVVTIPPPSVVDPSPTDGATDGASGSATDGTTDGSGAGDATSGDAETDAASRGTTRDPATDESDAGDGSSSGSTALGGTGDAGTDDTDAAGTDDAARRDATVAEVLALVDEHRATAGCPTLVPDDALTAAAQSHAQSMDAEGYMSHTGSDGRSFDERIRDAGYDRPTAENVAQGQTTAAQVVADWMASPGHRANIESCASTATGVGLSGTSWVQTFGA
ncbi:uncharacterized protein YkwD [Sediminihabitans luteus]|uniref:Uncharacterized protein YkwD n=1 Tax=Sediminihabitans luteus TaxID=1138585 RepID=A0A2M9CD68_9CELL|nr:CAP domain-containing protein [Sediminihabitans luteus]PJJ69288.1 uncharacterized protein YkwD [Sediminihabitans luteus]GII98970.1 hypothetical protein Slu03_13480 [Sediminihabitans luteus]